jgi:hypothetical protein
VTTDDEYFESAFHEDPSQRVVVRWDVHIVRPDGENVTQTGVTLVLDTGVSGAGGTAELRTGMSAPEGHPEAFVETGGQDVIFEEMLAVDSVHLVERGLVVRGKERIEGSKPVEVVWYAVPYPFPV